MDALEIMAGVGIPEGVTGIPTILFVEPVRRYSASAAGVNRVSSGDAPANVIPGMRLVSVVPITSRKRSKFTPQLERLGIDL
ncbi:hypothetical protein GCM10007116_22300 [Sulfodiicoccus acidiphilus]|uniref:Uncharacterized protein n=1 Tax=Sulfodiicoccus acidiphilus TaxID=1670455 RepID=A0A830H6P6_9CREN|nr:hypothetical protein GCM10007116_22300 [Sulfodiicoccus acidiphilus]